jgi:SAM-dependent methyltransferase
MDQSDFYNGIADVYDVMINWDARLEREGPFFQKIFQERGVGKVLDSAAAGGRHVRYFREQGYEAHGSDFSGEMIAECRRADPSHASDYFVSDFRDLANKASAPYDAALCLGCSLPHLPTESNFSKALDNFAAILKPGGVLITQFVNFDKILKYGERIRPLNHTVRADGEYFFLRVYDFISVTEMVIHLNILIKRGMDWEWKTQSTTLFPITAGSYLELLEKSGFRDIQCYGDYTFSPYEEETSSDLVVVAVNS